MENLVDRGEEVASATCPKDICWRFTVAPMWYSCWAPQQWEQLAIRKLVIIQSIDNNEVSN
jgi:hypothetical protein